MPKNIITTGVIEDVYLTPYKSYVAILDQVGNNDPVATVMNSADTNFLGNIVWTRAGAGYYLGTLAASFPLAKTVIFISSTDGVLVEASNQEDGEPSNSVFIRTGVSDGALYLSSLEIRVYP